ncbi:FKBP-type peptidyl-prolyl cis-trans isomerase [Candidatus Macondimonas diazotrophica]|jgi:FKBP-type peptidyl-prolyl cis-trans isomerase SlyD|uniref:Peptidyl-prolyl cis-trans isomerase n=1 Tax=Candidatus Macondimonas diazotrophica TaxID=2305248 RepID=A0A4Z0FBJ9_9GAMM|nr:peptidylprolyl isomerase [Candidatus Macondimonas diazotrophica]NCU01228.1 peptidylprolyl isomerase [Candidatus Macondimonas diazotrophica]TFZ82876.1 peptidylprolyl isomerase [Candidatus Macondimonas diazotrophica]
MQIADNTVVVIDYTVTTPEGNLIDSSSQSGEPLTYLHGAGNIVPGLEQALAGRSAGDSFNVSVPPEQGYGERHDELIQVVHRDQFVGIERMEIGMQFQTEAEGEVHIVTVTGLEGDQVVVDANHPLAGETLVFDITVREVRPATEEEVTHGHVHGSGGHHH